MEGAVHFYEFFSIRLCMTATIFKDSLLPCFFMMLVVLFMVGQNTASISGVGRALCIIINLFYRLCIFVWFIVKCLVWETVA